MNDPFQDILRVFDPKKEGKRQDEKETLRATCKNMKQTVKTHTGSVKSPNCFLGKELMFLLSNKHVQKLPLC